MMVESSHLCAETGAIDHVCWCSMNNAKEYVSSRDVLDLHSTTMSLLALYSCHTTECLKQISAKAHVKSIHIHVHVCSY